MPAGRYPGRMHPHRDSQIPKLLAAHEAGQFVRVDALASVPDTTAYNTP